MPKGNIWEGRAQELVVATYLRMDVSSARISKILQ